MNVSHDAKWIYEQNFRKSTYNFSVPWIAIKFLGIYKKIENKTQIKFYEYTGVGFSEWKWGTNGHA